MCISNKIGDKKREEVDCADDVIKSNKINKGSLITLIK
jgi:hypothetical protein